VHDVDRLAEATGGGVSPVLPVEEPFTAQAGKRPGDGARCQPEVFGDQAGRRRRDPVVVAEDHFEDDVLQH
jgi:hypothetical protein